MILAKLAIGCPAVFAAHLRAEAQGPLLERSGRRSLERRPHSDLELTEEQGPVVQGVLAAEGSAADARSSLRQEKRAGETGASRGTVAVLLFGETFRDGWQGSRATGTPASEVSQANASASQMRYLIGPLRQHGYRALCFLATSASHVKPRQHSQLLLGWYGDCIPPGPEAQPRWTEGRGVQQALDIYKNTISATHLQAADYFILMRPDLIIKKDLFTYWERAKEKVAFPFREWCIWNVLTDCHKDWHQKCWRVPDRLVALPRHALELMLRRGFPVDHEMYMRFVNTRDSSITTNLTFWIDEEHDADTKKDPNPFYEIAGRPTREADVQCKPSSPYRRIRRLINQRRKKSSDDLGRGGFKGPRD